jgi:hypothetical protein
MRRWLVAQRLVTAMAVATGFSVVWASVVGFLATTVYYLCREELALETLHFYDDEPVILIQQPRAMTTTGYRDVDGNMRPKPEGSRWMMAADLPDTSVRQNLFFEMPWRERLVGFNDGGQPPRYWYFIEDGRRQGSGYFVVFDSITKRSVGYVGTAGMRAEVPPPSERFRVEGGHFRLLALLWPCESSVAMVAPGDQSSGYSPGFFGYRDALVAAGQQLFHVDLADGSVNVMCTLPQPALSIEQVWHIRSGEWRRQFMGVRTAEGLLLVDRTGRIQETWPIPAAARDRELHFVRAGGSVSIFMSQSRELSRWHCQLWWVDQSGAVEQTRDFYLQLAPPELYERTGKAPYQAALVPVPLGIAIGMVIVRPLTLLAWNDSPTFAEAAATSVAESWGALIATLLFSAALAVVVWRRQRHFAASKAEQWAWAVFVLLFGLPGLVAYWAHRHWPAFEQCAACGEATPMDRDGCAWCGVPHPAAAPTGAEIFA